MGKFWIKNMNAHNLHEWLESINADDSVFASTKDKDLKQSIAESPDIESIDLLIMNASGRLGFPSMRNYLIEYDRLRRVYEAILDEAKDIYRKEKADAYYVFVKHKKHYSFYYNLLDQAKRNYWWMQDTAYQAFLAEIKNLFEVVDYPSWSDPDFVQHIRGW